MSFVSGLIVGSVLLILKWDLVVLFIGDKLESFLKKFPDYPNAFLIGSAADIFVTEIADQVTTNTFYLNLC